jgi:hypothetical protein
LFATPPWPRVEREQLESSLGKYRREDEVRMQEVKQLHNEAVENLRRRHDVALGQVRVVLLL